jgi:hypothetical protein
VQETLEYRGYQIRRSRKGDGVFYAGFQDGERVTRHFGAWDEASHDFRGKTGEEPEEQLVRWVKELIDKLADHDERIRAAKQGQAPAG